MYNCPINNYHYSSQKYSKEMLITLTLSTILREQEIVQDSNFSEFIFVPRHMSLRMKQPRFSNTFSILQSYFNQLSVLE